MRSLNSMLCRFYDHPGGSAAPPAQLADRATDCVLSCGTRLIIIDDVHFLDMNRRDGREVANHFKWLASQFPVTFLFVGVGLTRAACSTEGSGPGDTAFAQTARRWTTLSLDPFEIGTDAGRRTGGGCCWRSNATSSCPTGTAGCSPTISPTTSSPDRRATSRR